MNGLKYSFWDFTTGATWASPYPWPDGIPPSRVAITDVVNFDSTLSESGSVQFPGGYYSQLYAEFTGSFFSNTTELYTIKVRSDDGVKVWIDDILVIDNWNQHSIFEDTHAINLVAGIKHAIRIRYFQDGFGAVLHLLWESASVSEETIPTTNLDTNDILTSLTDPIPLDNPIIYYKADEPHISNFSNPEENSKIHDSGLLSLDAQLKSDDFEINQFYVGYRGFNHLPPWSIYSINIPTDGGYGPTDDFVFFEVPISFIETLVDWSFECWVRINQNEINIPVFTFYDSNSQHPSDLRDNYLRQIYLILNGIDFLTDPNEAPSTIIGYRNTDKIPNRLRLKGPIIPEGEVAHLCVTYNHNATSLSLYLNGSLIGAALIDISLADFKIDKVRIGFDGGFYHQPRQASYLIDNIAFYNKTLDATQVHTHYTGFGTPPGTINLISTLDIFDFVSVNVVYNRSLSDTLVFSDFRGSGIFLSDSLTLTDHLGITSLVVIHQGDDFEIKDALTFSKGTVIGITDLLLLEDIALVCPTKSFTDTLNLIDFVSFEGQTSYHIQDNLVLVDSVVAQVAGKYHFSLIDTLFLFDFVIPPIPQSQRLRDNLFLQDSLSVSGAPSIEISKDQLVFSDQVKTNLFVITVKDILALQEKLHKNLSKFELFDNLNLVETLHVSPFKISLKDTLIFTDTGSFLDNHQYLQDDLDFDDNVDLHYSIINLTLTDTLTLTDDVRVFPDPIRLFDTLTLTDVVGRSKDFNLTDTLVLTDSAIRLQEENLLDTLTLTDSLTVFAGKNIIDTLQFMDSVCLCFIGSPYLIDNLVLTDFVHVLINGTSFPPPPGTGGGGGITIHTIFRRKLTDRLFLEDRVSGGEGRKKQCCQQQIVLKFTSTNTWTSPANMDWSKPISVEVLGNGGNSGANGGGGGGGAAWSLVRFENPLVSFAGMYGLGGSSPSVTLTIDIDGANPVVARDETNLFWNASDSGQDGLDIGSGGSPGISSDQDLGSLVLQTSGGGGNDGDGVVGGNGGQAASSFGNGGDGLGSGQPGDGSRGGDAGQLGESGKKGYIILTYYLK